MLTADSGKDFKLFRPLLSFPDPDLSIEDQPTMDFPRIHLIERLCSYLIDSTRQDVEVSLNVSLPYLSNHSLPRFNQ
jgi:hypothetical protein